jgi:signal transduction histidine kinase
MKYRAQLINGSLDIRNGPSGGTTVECVLDEK